ncbi:MAG: hypothetical protein A2Y10_03605 [Planctomycetes bacterium GWF2_41_51]|nr:MAG: hypothetical protein A2Y10_03605 [Planctomycetes bacterium GWF2_41_51]HBG28829.1 hypothetical protein [Phycisphaerales bacterium]
MFKSVRQRVENFKKFYKHENERPLLGFFMESEYPVARYFASQKLPDNRPLNAEDFVCEDYLADYDRLFEVHEKAGGDFIWSASAFWGIPWLEAALGCEIYKCSKTLSLHAHIHQTFKQQQYVPDFEPNNEWVKKSVEFTKLIAEHSKGRYPIATPRLRGIADLLAALYGNEAFIYNFFETPELMKQICNKLTDFWIKFAKAILSEIPLFHDGVGSFYYHMWAPAGSVWHQEDAAALLSPDIYEQFILPCDIRIAESFGGCFMHMHPTGFYPYKQMLDAPMTCLELHIDQGGPDAEKLYSVHTEILKKKPLIIWGQISDKDLDWIFSKLPHQGLAVNVAVDSIEEARRIWEKYSR